MLSDEIQIRIHFWLATPTSLIFVKQITLNSELSNFDNVSILQSSRCCGLSISVLWTMIIHARFLIKTCHHASHFYALNKHNYLCICLEIFLSKCKPLARVDPIINRPLTNWCESPCKKSIFDVGITKIKWVEELSDMGKRLNIVLFFCLFAFLLLKWTISSFNKTEKHFQHSLIICLTLTSHPSFCSYRVSVSLFSSIQLSTKWHRNTHWML